MIKYMNGKGEDFIKKEKYVNLIEQLYQLYRDEFDGNEIEDNQIKENNSRIEELKKLIEDEELTEEEKAKLEEWKKFCNWIQSLPMANYFIVQVIIYMKEILLKVKKKDLEFLIGIMVINILENSKNLTSVE